jgi:hypothetical protein
MSVLGFGNRSTSEGLHVFRAQDVFVSYGVNYGEPISFADELQPDDIYQIAPMAAPHRLMLDTGAEPGTLAVAQGSDLGAPDAPLFIDSVLTMMTTCGKSFELFLIVELEQKSQLIADIYVMPLTEMRPQTDYTLLSIDRSTAPARFAGLAYSSFVRGTRITMADGEARPIEEIETGDMVLTRDDTAQEVRWVGTQNMRASEAFAPVGIAAGALDNSRDLWVSPNQRLVVGQTGEAGSAEGQWVGAEALVSAAALVNGETITRAEIGAVTYHQILLDGQEPLFAEGVAAEGLTVDPRMLPALPLELQRIVAQQSSIFARDRKGRKKGKSKILLQKPLPTVC